MNDDRHGTVAKVHAAESIRCCSARRFPRMEMTGVVATSAISHENSQRY